MKLQVFQIAQTAVDKLRVLAAGAGGEVFLFHQADPQRNFRMLHAQREIANYARAVDAPANYQNVYYSGP
jgi:hypothetical protein